MLDEGKIQLILDIKNTVVRHDRFFVAGGFLLSTFNDIDIWFYNQEDADSFTYYDVSESENAKNVMFSNFRIQFMKLARDPKDLVLNHFDLTILQQYSDSSGNIWQSDKCIGDMQGKVININPEAKWVIKDTIFHRVLKYSNRLGFELSHNSFDVLAEVITSSVFSSDISYDYTVIKSYAEHFEEDTLAAYFVAYFGEWRTSTWISKFFLKHIDKINPSDYNGPCDVGMMPIILQGNVKYLFNEYPNMLLCLVYAGTTSLTNKRYNIIKQAYPELFI